MKVRVDRMKCQGYGLCAGASPELFDLDDSGQAFVRDEVVEDVPPELADAATKAAMKCPERAIVVERDPS